MMGLLDEPEDFQVGHKQMLEALTMRTTETRWWSGDDLTITLQSSINLITVCTNRPYKYTNGTKARSIARTVNEEVCKLDSTKRHPDRTKARFIATTRTEKTCSIRGWEGYGFDSTKGYPGEGPTSSIRLDYIY